MGRQRRGALLAGIAMGVLIGAVPIVNGVYAVESSSTYSAGDSTTVAEALVVAVSVLLVVAAWFACFLLLRAHGLNRPMAVTWWSIGATVAGAAVIVIVVGFVAFFIGAFTALMTWSGQFVDPLVVAGSFVSAGAIVVTALLITTGIAKALRAPAPAVAPPPAVPDAPPIRI
jgi:hypothetical protein